MLLNSCFRVPVEKHVKVKWPHGAFRNRNLVRAQKRAVRTLGHQQGLFSPEGNGHSGPSSLPDNRFHLCFPWNKWKFYLMEIFICIIFLYKDGLITTQRYRT